MEPTDNPYSVLGIPETATPREIRTAYRRLALEHHPDRNPNDTTFAKINHSYEVLTKQTGKTSEYQPPRHDPFSVFESVFRDDFNQDFFQRRDSTRNHPFFQRHQHDPFFSGSSFFKDPFSHFDDDPFFRSSPFRSNDLFGRMDDMFGRMDDLLQQQQQHESGSKRQNPNTSFYSTSTTSRRDSNGRWVTETKTNKNGEVSTEYITRDADGNILEERRSVEPPKIRAMDDNDAHESPSKKSFFRLPWRRDND